MKFMNSVVHTLIAAQLYTVMLIWKNCLNSSLQNMVILEQDLIAMTMPY